VRCHSEERLARHPMLTAYYYVHLADLVGQSGRA
jgi:hypothetical protein